MSVMCGAVYKSVCMWCVVRYVVRCVYVSVGVCICMVRYVQVYVVCVQVCICGAVCAGVF